MPKGKNNRNQIQLVKKLQSGNRKAFEEIYYALHQPIYANILKVTKDPFTAKDLLQEVFITLWRKKRTIDPTKPIANWLFVISFNLSINHIKRNKINIIPLDSSSERMPNSSSLHEKIDEELKWDMLEEAIEQLSPQKKNVFRLCKIEHKTYEETAKELNISKHTVKEYLSLAMHSIKEYIKDKNPDQSALAILITYFFL